MIGLDDFSGNTATATAWGEAARTVVGSEPWRRRKSPVETSNWVPFNGKMATSKTRYPCLSRSSPKICLAVAAGTQAAAMVTRSEEHTSELQSLRHLVCRLLLEKK